MQDEELQGEHSSVQNSADNPSLGSSAQLLRTIRIEEAPLEKKDCYKT